jgi:hypothetical protein
MSNTNPSINRRAVAIGDNFERLTVIAELPSKRGRRFVICKCDCGAEKRIGLWQLLLGKTKSCGCLIRSPAPIGSRFGMLTVLAEYRADIRSVPRRVICVCDCGSFTRPQLSHLVAGTTKTCGCTRRKNYHGHCRPGNVSVEYKTWVAMIQRCSNPKHPVYSHYGARGIRVCERWEKFENFYADMGKRPSADHSIDRYPDNNGDYEPGNCRWATQTQQMNNTRGNVVIAAFGKSQTQTQWARELNIPWRTIYRRLKRGDSPERALRPKNQTR